MHRQTPNLLPGECDLKRSPSNPILLTPIAIGLSLIVTHSAFAQKPPKANASHAPGSHPPKPEKSIANKPPKPPSGPKLTGPERIDKLANMSPEELHKALDRLPPQRQQQLQQAITKYQQMTPEQRQYQIARAQQLQSLPPEEQQRIRQAIQSVNSLPADRQKFIHREVNQMKKMTPEEREARLASADFKSKFSPSEQEIIQHMGEGLPDIQF